MIDTVMRTGFTAEMGAKKINKYGGKPTHLVLIADCDKMIHDRDSVKYIKDKDITITPLFCFRPREKEKLNDSWLIKAM